MINVTAKVRKASHIALQYDTMLNDHIRNEAFHCLIYHVYQTESRISNTIFINLSENIDKD